MLPTAAGTKCRLSVNHERTIAPIAADRAKTGATASHRTSTSTARVEVERGAYRCHVDALARGLAEGRVESRLFGRMGAKFSAGGWGSDDLSNGSAVSLGGKGVSMTERGQSEHTEIKYSWVAILSVTWQQRENPPVLCSYHGTCSTWHIRSPVSQLNSAGGIRMRNLLPARSRYSFRASADSRRGYPSLSGVG